MGMNMRKQMKLYLETVRETRKEKEKKKKEEEE